MNREALLEIINAEIRSYESKYSCAGISLTPPGHKITITFEESPYEPEISKLKITKQTTSGHINSVETTFSDDGHIAMLSIE